MIEKIEGLITSTSDYSETSKILNVFTLKYGLISIIAKGCKRKNSTFSLLEPLMMAEFNIYYKENKVSTLKSCDIINIYKNIRKDYDLINSATFIIKTSLQVYKQDNSSEIYNILSDVLYKMNELFDPIVLINIALIKYLYYLGVPIQEKCIICSSTTNIYTISSDIGGYICRKCYTNQPILNEKTIKYIRMFNYINIKKISKINIEDNVKKEISSFIFNYYNRYTGIYLNNKLLGDVYE